jgi:hypothetical protein
MKRVLILSLVFMLLMGLNTFATQTRTLTMGDNDGIMVDDYNIFRFPGRLFSYPNIAVSTGSLATRVRGFSGPISGTTTSR